MKVRATQDGHYAGYYRTGPVTSDAGTTPGEVFEIDAKPFVVLDPDSGKPVLEKDEDGHIVYEMVNGKPKLDANGKKIAKVKMATWFSAEWMEKVSEDTPVTNDYPPFQLPSPYRAKNKAPAANAPATLKDLSSVI